MSGLDLQRLVMHYGVMAAARRISVSLEASDQEVLDAFATEDRAEHAVLAAWAAERGTPVRDSSEAALLRVLIRVGAEALRERALEQGYAKLRAAPDVERAERAALRDRYAARTDRRFTE